MSLADKKQTNQRFPVFL